MQHPEVHTNNKLLATKTMAFLQHQMGMVVNYGVHPITKTQISVYSIEDTNIGTRSIE